jgi:hypothetical protein
MMKWFRRGAAPAESATKPAPQVQALERVKRGVLVVDGDIAAAAAAVQVGDKTNEIVSTAYSIGKALGLAARFHYKTILLAHEQIDGTGEDLVRQLKDRGLIDLTRLYTMTRANPTVISWPSPCRRHNSPASWRCRARRSDYRHVRSENTRNRPGCSLARRRPMTKVHDLEKLRNQHATLELAIAQAYKRPQPDLDAIAELKKRKLALKDEIARIHEASDD